MSGLDFGVRMLTDRRATYSMTAAQMMRKQNTTSDDESSSRDDTCFTVVPTRLAGPVRCHGSHYTVHCWGYLLSNRTSGTCTRINDNKNKLLNIRNRQKVNNIFTKDAKYMRINKKQIQLCNIAKCCMHFADFSLQKMWHWLKNVKATLIAIKHDRQCENVLSIHDGTSIGDNWQGIISLFSKL